MSEAMLTEHPKPALQEACSIYVVHLPEGKCVTTSVPRAAKGQSTLEPLTHSKGQNLQN